jgi:trans-aconitate 2-methyltransferase
VSDRDATWDPVQYHRFSDHRARPARELLQRVPLGAPSLVVDLGCGTGGVTRLLATRWPGARVVGVDHSPAMLAEARAGGGDIEWLEADAAAWQPDAAPDLIFSNAVLHWLDDHGTLLPRLLSLLTPGGCLAVQLPRSWDLPSHRIMREVLAELRAPAELQRQLARDPVLDSVGYHAILSAHAQDLDIWETDYLQVLSGEDPVLSWVLGAGLRPVLAALTETARQAFLAAYQERLREAYPANATGRTLYPFRRVFMVARR